MFANKKKIYRKFPLPVFISFEQTLTKHLSVLYFIAIHSSLVHTHIQYITSPSPSPFQRFSFYLYTFALLILLLTKCVYLHTFIHKNNIFCCFTFSFLICDRNVYFPAFIAHNTSYKFKILFTSFASFLSCMRALFDILPVHTK